MVQSYGGTDDAEQEHTIDTHDGESRALLGDDAAPKKIPVDGTANLSSGISNLANTIIGSGTYAFILFGF